MTSLTPVLLCLNRIVTITMAGERRRFIRRRGRAALSFMGALGSFRPLPRPTAGGTSRHIDVTSAPPTPMAGAITTPSDTRARRLVSFWKFHSGEPFMPG
jgi:hypothetical protein